MDKYNIFAMCELLGDSITREQERLICNEILKLSILDQNWVVIRIGKPIIRDDK